MLVDLVLESYSFLLPVELPLALVELGVELDHLVILLGYLLNKLLPLPSNLSLFTDLLHIFQGKLVRLVNVVLPVGSFNSLPKTIVLVDQQL